MLGALVARVATEGPSAESTEVRLLASDGALLWARARLGLVRNAKGFPDHLVVLLGEVAEG